jgi:MFS family permease
MLGCAACDSLYTPLKEPRSATAILTPLGIGLMLSLLGDSTLYAVLPAEAIATQAGVTLAMVGLLLGANRLARLLFNNTAGWLYDRLPRRPLMLISLAIGTCATVFYAAGSGMGWMLSGRVLWGLAWSGLWIGANSMVLDIADDNNRGHINGQLQMWFFIGVSVSAFAGGLFTDLFTYRGGLWISTGLSAAGWLLWLRFLPETRPAYGSEYTLQRTRIRMQIPWRIALTCSLPYLVMRLIFAGVLTSTTILWLSQFMPAEGASLNGWVMPLATLSGSFIAIRVLVSVVSAPLVGRFSDWVGRRWLVLALILLVFGGGGLWLLSLPVFALSMIGALLSAVAGGSIQVIVPTIIGDRVANNQQARVLGIVFTAGDLGSAIGPALALALVPFTGLRILYGFCAVLYGFTAIFAAFLAWGERERRQQNSLNL